MPDICTILPCGWLPPRHVVAPFFLVFGLVFLYEVSNSTDGKGPLERRFGDKWMEGLFASVVGTYLLLHFLIPDLAEYLLPLTTHSQNITLGIFGLVCILAVVKVLVRMHIETRTHISVRLDGPTSTGANFHSRTKEAGNMLRTIRELVGKPEPKERKQVRYNGPFLGNGWVLAFFLVIGGISIFLGWNRRPFDPQQFLFGSVLLLLGIGYYLYSKRDIGWVPIVPKAKDPSSPSTPEETKQAYNHLRVALAFRKEAFEEKNNHAQLRKIGQSSIALSKARSLDPNLTITDEAPEDGGAPFTYTQDAVAADLLYLESLLFSKQAEASSMEAMNAIGKDRWNDGTKFHKRKEKEELQKALNAIERALKYTPNSALYHCQLAKVYNLLDNRKGSRAAVNRALELAPDDIDVLKLHSSLG